MNQLLPNKHEDDAKTARVLNAKKVNTNGLVKRWMDEIPYQYQKTDRNWRMQVSRGKLAKSKKACETHG
jgi:hypothetical protein